MTTDRATRGRREVAATTAVLFVEGRRVGSAVLVTDRRLLTAGHALNRVGQGESATSANIELAFPAVPAAAGARVAATRVALEPGAEGVDVGLLDVAGELPGWLPSAVPLSPRQRLPDRVSVFGFPAEEKALRGVWREFDISGPAADGTVQLDWVGAAGTLPGHSGGPVIDVGTGELLGVLVQGSQAGRFDRFLPLFVIAACCPGLPRPWLMAGMDARTHFTRRARSQQSRTRGGDLFRGRRTALEAVCGWLTGAGDPGRPLVVTGQPGAGKSAVLAKAALELEADRAAPGLGFHARGALLADVLAAVADLFGIESADSPEALLDALDEDPPHERTIITVDGLDEAAAAQDRQQIARTLAELATVPNIRVAVATRPVAVGNRYAPGGLLPALGITSADSPALVDLDTDRYYEPAGLRQFAAALLAQREATHPNPPGAAWTAYRADTALCERLSGVIATRAQRNYLVAAMAAVPLSTADHPVDPAATGFEPTGIPSGVGEALDKYLRALPDPQQGRTHALLTALAYARGAGIDDRTWLNFSEALGYPATIADLDQLRCGAAADYLLESVPDGDGPATRLFHQSFSDELLAQRRYPPGDERALLLTLIPPGDDWSAASAYALTYAANHAAGAGQLLRLLDDPDYLAHADVARLPALLRLEPQAAVSPAAVVIRRVAARANDLPAARRIRLLALTAAHLGLHDLQRRLGSACTEPFTPTWAHSLGVPHQEITDTKMVYAVTIGRAGDRDIIVSGGDAGMLRVRDAKTGQPLGERLTGHHGAVVTVAVGRAGGRDVIASGGWDGTVRVWDAESGQPVGEPLTSHTDVVRSVAIGRAGDRDVIVSGGDDGTLRVWDVDSGLPIGEPLTSHRDAVNAVAIGRAGDRDVIVSGGGVRPQFRDPYTFELIAKPLAGEGKLVAEIQIGGAGIGDNTVRIWDAATGAPIGGPLTGHTDKVRGIAIGRAGDRDVIVSSSRDVTVRIWDARTGQSIGKPISEAGSGMAVAIGRAGNRDVIVASLGSAVQSWDACTGEPIGMPLTGHTTTVPGVAIGRAGDRDVIVSGGHDLTVRIWDLSVGGPIADPLSGHIDSVTSLAIGRARDRDVVVSGSSDKTIRIWDASTGEPVGKPLTGHTSQVTCVASGRAGDRDIIVSNGGDRAKEFDMRTGQFVATSASVQAGTHTVRIWDANTGEPLGEPLAGHTDTVNTVAIGRAGGRDLIVSGSGTVFRGTGDATARIWDASTGEPIGEPLTGHSREVRSVAIGRIVERDVIVTSGDRTVRIWDAKTSEPVGEPHAVDHWVHSVAIGRLAGRDVIVSGGDTTVRIWDAMEGTWVELDLLANTDAVALSDDGSGLYVSTGSAICLFEA